MAYLGNTHAARVDCIASDLWLLYCMYVYFNVDDVCLIAVQRNLGENLSIWLSSVCSMEPQAYGFPV